ncbi:MAG: nitroreductase family protein [Thermomicrobiales bacterium]
MDFQDVVRKRRMVRHFTPEPVPEATVKRIVSMAQRAPSAGFSQGVVFVAVTDEVMRKRVGEISSEEIYVNAGYDPFISEAPVQIIVCTSEQVYHDRYNEGDKKPEGEDEINWPIPYWHTDAGCALMLVLLAAVNEGLGSAFVGVQDPRQLQALLNIPADYLPIGVAMIGHAAPDKKSPSLKRGRRKVEDVLHVNGW